MLGPNRPSLSLFKVAGGLFTEGESTVSRERVRAPSGICIKVSEISLQRDLDESEATDDAKDAVEALCPNSVPSRVPSKNSAI